MTVRGNVSFKTKYLIGWETLLADKNETARVERVWRHSENL